MPDSRRKLKQKQQVLDRLTVVHAAWPFSDPPDTGCYVSRGLMDGSTVVEAVVHDHHGDWQILDGSDPNGEDAVMLVCLEDVVRRHPVVGALGELDVGWQAEMDFDVPEWEASPLLPEADDSDV